METTEKTKLINQPEPQYVPQRDYQKLINECKSVQLNGIMNKYEINSFYSEKFLIIEDYDIVFLIDDSSTTSELNDSQQSIRLEQLKHVVRIVIDIATIFIDDGVDLFFLNREPKYNIKNVIDIDTILTSNQSGRKPLTKICNDIFLKYENNTKPVLLIIATDCVLNDTVAMNNFTECIKNRDTDKFFISFLACSDNDIDNKYLNNLDKKIKNVGTLVDYISEEKEVQNAQGKQFRYSLGDHVVRLLLRQLCPELDKLDEKRLKNGKKCIIL